MKAEQMEVIKLEMERSEFNSLLYYLRSAGNKTKMEDVDAKKADVMRLELIGMVGSV